MTNLTSQPPTHYWAYSDTFIDELAQYLQGKKVLEVFAGNGYLASFLHARGIDIQATSLLSSHDGHEHGFLHPVEVLSASDAADIYRIWADVLLMSWPTVSPDALMAAIKLDVPIVFIGEVTDYSKNDLGGCATDLFFELTTVVHEFTSYKGNCIEHAQVRELIL